MIERAYADGVLDRVEHARLVADLDAFAERAGVPPEAICQHLGAYAGAEESDWVLEFLRRRRAPHPGLVWLGTWSDVQRRCVGIAGALVRNFVDARVASLADLVEDPPVATVLLLPATRGPQWQRDVLAGVLVERASRGVSTLLHATCLDELGAARGVVDGSFWKLRA